jgi:DNA mismatch repair protein MutH
MPCSPLMCHNPYSLEETMVCVWPSTDASSVTEEESELY